MFTRYLKTALLLAAIFIGYGLSLLPLMLVRPHLQFQPFVGALLIWGLLCTLTLPFLLREIIRKVWFFKGHGEPVIKELLESLLLSINDFKSPVIVRKKRGKLLCTWRCNEPQWCEPMTLAGVHKNYELILRFDVNTRTVQMIDRVRSVDFDLCPIKVKTGFFALPRLYCSVQTGAEWGLNNFKQTTVTLYRFDPMEIKSPIFNIIISNGRNVQFSPS